MVYAFPHFIILYFYLTVFGAFYFLKLFVVSVLDYVSSELLDRSLNLVKNFEVINSVFYERLINLLDNKKGSVNFF